MKYFFCPANFSDPGLHLPARADSRHSVAPPDVPGTAGACSVWAGCAFPLSDGSGNVRAFDCSAGPTSYDLAMPHRLQIVATEGLAERGVYLHPYQGTNGERFVVAINRKGDRILEATLPRGSADVGAVVRLMWSFLNDEDPTPQLTLLS